ncbi:MAG: aminoglycoside phosphotransferase family protein [Nocardioides sp.]
MAVSRLVLPPGLEKQRALGPDWGSWLDGLPRRLAGLLDDWQLTRDGDELWHGFCSLVAPVHDATGTPAVLKIAFAGDVEGADEAVALQHWQGRGAVRLLRADPHRRALLLERLPRRDLTEVPVLEACEIVAGLYSEIHVPALPQLATLASFVERWLDALAAQPRDIPIPHRYREQALSLGRDLLAETGADRIIHFDLHYENVLAAPADGDPARGEWLVIDPKALSGDPHCEPAPMLWNRYDELAGDVRDGLRRRFHTLVDVAGLDEDRARDWVVVRMVLNANWAVEDAQRAGRDLDDEEREWITRCIAISKAVQD